MLNAVISVPLSYQIVSEEALVKYRAPFPQCYTRTKKEMIQQLKKILRNIKKEPCNKAADNYTK